MRDKASLEKKFEEDMCKCELLIHKVCRIYARSTADRKDLFQEIVIQLWKAYPNFKGDCKLSTWVYRVSLNTAITQLRKQKNFITFYEPTALPINISAENSLVEETDMWQQMYMAIDQLNHVEKAIVMLYMEDKSYNEMVDIIGISTGALRVKMSRIKDKLRSLTKNN